MIRPESLADRKTTPMTKFFKITVAILFLALTNTGFPRGGSSSSTSRSKSSFSSSAKSSFSSASSSPYVSSKTDKAAAAASNQSGGSLTRSQAIASDKGTNPVTGSQSSNVSQSPPLNGARLPDGSYAPIYRDDSRGGYGYWDSLGHWILWSQLMQPRQTVIVNNYGDQGWATSSTYRGSGYSSHGGLILLILFIVVIGIAIWYYRSQTKEDSNLNDLEGIDQEPISKAPAGGEDLSKQNPEFQKWKRVTLGSILILKDLQALDDSRKEGRGMAGMNYTLTKKIHIQNAEGVNHWLFLVLNSNAQNLLMLVKASGGETDKRVYYEAEGFEAGTREDLLENQSYLFQAPENPADFDPAELKYATEIARTEAGKEILYTLKRQHEQTGRVKETPEGVSNLYGTIVEYGSGDPTDNPELLVLEIGKTADNGNIQLYLGAAISDSEVEILPNRESI